MKLNVSFDIYKLETSCSCRTALQFFDSALALTLSSGAILKLLSFLKIFVVRGVWMYAGFVLGNASIFLFHFKIMDVLWHNWFVIYYLCLLFAFKKCNACASVIFVRRISVLWLCKDLSLRFLGLAATVCIFRGFIR